VARCSERYTVRFELVADAATARRLRLSRSGRATILARATGSTAAAGALTRRLRPAAAVRRRLARAASVRLTVRAAAADPAGNQRVRSARTTLRAR
jgi:hypothetical protein